MAEEEQVVAVDTEDSCNQLLQNAIDSKKLEVCFTARDQRKVNYNDYIVDKDGCGLHHNMVPTVPAMEPIMEDLAKKLPNVIFVKVDVNELKSVASDWAISKMPTFMFLREGTILDKVIGSKNDDLQNTVAKHLATA